MKSFSACMETYQKQLKKGDIQVAYYGLMEYLSGLMHHLKKAHPEFYVSGNFYQGYLDFSYFPFTPNALKQRKLRIAVVFIHKTCQFKIWLVGINKKIQADYRQRIANKGWKKYPISDSAIGTEYTSTEYIIESTLADDPDFDDLPKLTRDIEKAILKFARDMEQLVAKL